MEITEPDPGVPGAIATFSQVNVTQIRFQRPSGATSTTVTVTCRGGGGASQTYTQSALTPVAISPTFCPAGVFPATVSVRYTGTDALGNGTIANSAVGRLDLTGNLLTSTPAGTLSNCGLSTVDNPVNSTGAASANGCANLAVAAPSGGLGPGTKTTGDVDVIVPGQPLTFSLSFRNTGNIPLTNVVLVDPPDPTVSTNPFTVVRLLSITVPPSPAAAVDVWDPSATGGAAYVPYDPANTALVARALGIRAPDHR